MACDIRLLGALVLSPYMAKLKPPLEVVVMTRISEALGGRIKQRAKEYAIQIRQDENKDLRLKG